MKHGVFVHAFNSEQYKNQLLQVLETETSQDEKFVTDLVLVKFIDTEWSL